MVLTGSVVELALKLVQHSGIFNSLWEVYGKSKTPLRRKGYALITSLCLLLLIFAQIKRENVAGPSSLGGDVKMEAIDNFDNDEEDEDMEEVSYS